MNNGSRKEAAMERYYFHEKITFFLNFIFERKNLS